MQWAQLLLCVDNLPALLPREYFKCNTRLESIKMTSDRVRMPALDQTGGKGGRCYCAGRGQAGKKCLETLQAYSRLAETAVVSKLKRKKEEVWPLNAACYRVTSSEVT